MTKQAEREPRTEPRNSRFLAIRSQDATNRAPGLTTRSKKLLGTKGIRSKDSTKPRESHLNGAILNPQVPTDSTGSFVAPNGVGIRRPNRALREA